MRRLTCLPQAVLLYFLAALAAQSQDLPAPPVDARVLEFTGPEEGWPPQVRGATDIRIIASEPVPTDLTPALTTRLGELAAASPEVQRAIGDRYVFTGATIVEDRKAEDPRPAEQQVAAAVFYSYSRNMAVRALVQGGEVLEVSDIEGYQPPETPEEVERAAELAREDERVRAAVEGLEARALLSERSEGQPSSGHRVLYVSFLAPGSAQTEYFALVDLTDGRVLDAGRAAGG